MKFTVVGPFEIAGRKRGETVELDPAEINIPALIDGGHIEPVSEPAGAAPVRKDGKAHG